MLDSLLNKDVCVVVAFSELQNCTRSSYSTNKIYEGQLMSYDNNFIKFADNTVIGVRYIISIYERP